MALHQFVADAASEPDLAYYDYWVPAGRLQQPTPTVDQAAIDFRWHRGPAAFRATGYVSTGRGLLEVRPVSDQGTGDGLFRTGRSRTAGLELQWTLSPPGRPDRVASLTYVLSQSQRDWGTGWVPWGLDRRHVARLQLASTIARRWRVDILADATSGPPFTPVLGALSLPLWSAGTFTYGRENSVRDISRVRADAGFTHHFNGPGTSRFFWGISLINLSWGPIAPLLPRSNIPFEADGSPLGYERIRRIPVIPTLTLRLEF